MFILVMQFFWKYIDDLMGKGLSVKVIVELLFYVSADLIPLALPLAILLSSIMTMGNLAENNELTALKSSGLPLYKIMKPLTNVVFVIAITTFYFSNYVIPIATLKWHSLIYDIQNTKISTIITPGVFSNQLEGYAIKVKEEKNNEFKDIIIHVTTDPTINKSIRAKSGKIYKSTNGNQLFFELHDGVINEELAAEVPNYSHNGILIKDDKNSRPSRKYNFKKATYKIDISGFQLNRSDEDLFKNQHEMLNVFQINEVVDSIQIEGGKVLENFTKSLKNEHAFFQATMFDESSISNNSSGLEEIERKLTKTYHIDSLTKEEKIRALSSISPNLRRVNQNIEGQRVYLKALENNIKMYLIGFHRKFALTFAIIVLFFIGAPLGAIVRKGGFGTPLVLAALLFMLYFILISIGESLALEGVVSPFTGMWFATYVLVPIAFLLMRSASNDSQVFNKEAYKKFFSKFALKK
jgi:lipopolysaccharide export system permease protein